MTQGRGSDVLVDVTSLISAEDYLLSQNRHARPGDPFARQCFVEIIQSLSLLLPLHLNPDEQSRAQLLERREITELKGVNGIRSMARFVDQALAIDRSAAGRQDGLSERLRAWGAF